MAVRVVRHTRWEYPASLAPKAKKNSWVLGMVGGRPCRLEYETAPKKGIPQQRENLGVFDAPEAAKTAAEQHVKNRGGVPTVWTSRRDCPTLSLVVSRVHTGNFRLVPLSDLEYLASLQSKKNPSQIFRLEYVDAPSRQIKDLGVFETKELAKARARADMLGQTNQTPPWVMSRWSRLCPPAGSYTSCPLLVEGKHLGSYRLIPVDELEYLASLAKRNPPFPNLQGPFRLDQLNCDGSVLRTVGYFEDEAAAQVAGKQEEARLGFRISRHSARWQWGAGPNADSRFIPLLDQAWSTQGFMLYLPVSDLEYLASLAKKNPRVKANPDPIRISGPVRLEYVHNDFGEKVVKLGIFDTSEEAKNFSDAERPSRGSLGGWYMVRWGPRTLLTRRVATAGGHGGSYRLVPMSDLEYLSSKAKTNSVPACRLILRPRGTGTTGEKTLGVFETSEHARSFAREDIVTRGWVPFRSWISATWDVGTFETLTALAAEARGVSASYRIVPMDELEYLTYLTAKKNPLSRRNSRPVRLMYTLYGYGNEMGLGIFDNEEAARACCEKKIRRHQGQAEKWRDSDWYSEGTPGSKGVFQTCPLIVGGRRIGTFRLVPLDELEYLSTFGKR